MYDYLASLVCKQKLESHGLDISSYNEDDNYYLSSCYSIDDLPLVVPLWRKYNLRAYNFLFEIGSCDTPVIRCDLVGEKDSFSKYFNDIEINKTYYLVQIKKLFKERSVKISKIIEARKQYERMEEFRSNPPPRMKYNAITHRFVL